VKALIFILAIFVTTSEAVAEKVFVSWEEIHKVTFTLTEKLKESSKEVPWKGIVAITRGGLVPAGIIANLLNLRHIKVVCLSSYASAQQATQTKHEVLEAIPILEDGGRGWIVVDDIVDTGKTIDFVRKRLPNAHYAVIYVRKNFLSKVETYGSVVPEKWSWIVFPWEKLPSQTNFG